MAGGPWPTPTSTSARPPRPDSSWAPLTHRVCHGLSFVSFIAASFFLDTRRDERLAYGRVELVRTVCVSTPEPDDGDMDLWAKKANSVIAKSSTITAISTLQTARQSNHPFLSIAPV